MGYFWDRNFHKFHKLSLICENLNIVFLTKDGKLEYN